jgi:hypothetical protein
MANTVPAALEAALEGLKAAREAFALLARDRAARTLSIAQEQAALEVQIEALEERAVESLGLDEDLFKELGDRSGEAYAAVQSAAVAARESTGDTKWQTDDFAVSTRETTTYELDAQNVDAFRAYLEESAPESMMTAFPRSLSKPGLKSVYGGLRAINLSPPGIVVTKTVSAAVRTLFQEDPDAA